ncbi:ABC transporter permease [Burkholderia sp. SCN-KJ]|uniref:ABC transporter permease n=1 Tax=Burkholderia sp. SCN-KJ TaxID=2969248 RepID=UPI00214F8A3C|nr:ABC transporter permease [Burkholderia sp. SCN-KJ]MCR4471586.1 ABC transporter permease [Burkholderia sp. SCN-KJ]
MKNAITASHNARLHISGASQLVKNFAILPFIIILVVGGASVSNVFLSLNNLLNILNMSSILMMVVAAQLLVLLVGEIDLSVESVVTLAPMCAALMMAPTTSGGVGYEWNGFAGILIAVLVGTVSGVINAFLVVNIRLNAFITTLAMLILLRGLALGVGKGNTVYGLPDEFLYLGQGRVAGVPMPIWVAGVVVISMSIFLRYHWLGRSVYVVGSNPEAARTAGINVSRVKWMVFVASGVLSAIAGVMLTGRIAAATSVQGANLVFSVLAAAVIGGVSLNGGRGSVIGAFLGVLLLGLVQNIMVLAQVATYWIDATFGLIIVVALLLTRVVGGAQVR